MSEQYDIAIIGGGMVGLSLAVALAQSKFRVAVIESKRPVLQWQANDYDARVSAIHLGTHHFFESLNIWQSFRPQCYSPLESMQVWDAIGGGEINFNAADINRQELGFIVENREVIRVLWEYCESSDQVSLLVPAQATSIENKLLSLSNDAAIEAELFVGADGANSWLRQAMQEESFEKPYHQEAIVAIVKTEKPHFCLAYQPFLKSGPLGVLPLADPHQVAIVWSAHQPRCEILMAMADDRFNRELTNALSSKLGSMHCLSARKKIPLSQRHVKHYVQAHRALIGDAAHTIHPLAGQGANLGFMDAACLANVLAKAKNSKAQIGCYKVLRQYERWRKSENEMMLMTMAGFKSAFSSQSPLTVAIRSWGFNIVDRVKMLKRYFIRSAVHLEQ